MTNLIGEQSKWPGAVQRLLNDARVDVIQVLANHEVSASKELARVTGLPFQTRQFPMYFTGAFEAPLVMVHLNPKFSEQMDNPGFRDFEAYLEGHRRFGHLHWELDSTFKGPFDRKQVRFLRPFGVIDFLDDSDPRSDRTNPARAIDHKLQLELIPYASPDFPTDKLLKVDLSGHFERVLDVITDFPREYVLFCGAVFDELLKRSGRIVSQDVHRFNLPTKAGTSKSQYRFSNVLIRHDAGVLRAGVARSFATKGLPMDAYGIRCHELYGQAIGL